MNTRDLVADALSDRAGAPDRLMQHLLPQVVQWCHRLGGPRVDAEDAAHDVLVVVLTRLDTLHEVERLDAWVYGITRKVLASHRRRAWLKRWVPGFMPEVGDGRPSPERLSVMSEASRGVWTILNTLSDHHREVLVLCDIEERTDLEVATLLGVPLGTVKSRLRRARQRFRIAAEEAQLHTLATPAEA